jgi:hypothetical protein
MYHILISIFILFPQQPYLYMLHCCSSPSDKQVHGHGAEILRTRTLATEVGHH